MVGYVRKDTANNIADGNVVNASDLDNEFDGVVAAFNASTGHAHGGGTGEGSPILTMGPTQDVTVSATLLAPKTTNTVDIGSTALKFKDLYMAGNASIGGTLTVTGVATLGNGAVLGTPASGTVTNLTGTASININGTVGATTANTGAFTTLSASSTVSGTGFSTYLASPPAIGGTAAAAVSATTLTTSSTVTHNGGTANGVAYLNGSKVLTTGSALTFDGTSLGVAAAASSWAAAQPAIEVNGAASLMGTSNNAYLSANLYFNSGWKYKASTLAASYGQEAGDHIWWRAASGTAGAAATLAEQMRLTSTGLGIGTSSPTQKLQVNGASPRILLSDTGTGAPLLDVSSGGGSFYVGSDNSTGSTFSTAAYARLLWGIGAYPIVFATNNTERMRLDSAGNLGLGVTPSAWNVYRAFQFGPYSSVFSDTGGQEANFGTNVYYSSGFKYIGTGAATYFRQLNGGYAWFTAPSGTAGNAITFTQAMTLDASGRLGIGATSPSSYTTNPSAIVVSSSTATAYSASTIQAAPILTLYGGSGSGNATGMRLSQGGSYELFFGGVQNASGYGEFVWQGYGGSYAERMRLDASGNLLVGTTSALFGVTARQSVQQGSNSWAQLLQVTGSSGGAVLFQTAGTGGVGSITLTSSTTLYNTSSDYRLKNITGPITNSGAFMDKLNPVQGSWKADGSRFIGFLAHELQEASETVVGTGVKDGEEMQSIDYSNAELIANLVAEIQSLRKRLAAAGI